MSTFDPSLAAGRPPRARPEAAAKAGGPVIAHLPADLTEGIALEVLFRAPDQVDVRPAGGVWMPVELAGGQVEVRVR